MSVYSRFNYNLLQAAIKLLFLCVTTVFLAVLTHHLTIKLYLLSTHTSYILYTLVMMLRAVQTKKMQAILSTSAETTPGNKVAE